MTPARHAAIAALALVSAQGCDQTVVVGDLGADAAVAADGASDSAADSGDGLACSTNADCPDGGMFCSKADGDCAGQAVCALRPTSCPPATQTLCDCTHTNQNSACDAHLAGHNVDYAHLCDPNPQSDGGHDGGPPDGGPPSD